MSEGLTDKIIPETGKPGIRQRSCVFTNLTRFGYKRALDLQLSILERKINTPSAPDQLLFVEHPRVYTLGKRGGRGNLMVSQDFLDTNSIDVVKTDRGGDITYHGPGQAVLYPVLDLEKNRIGVSDFVFGMEEIMKLTVREFGIRAGRDKRNHGLWVGDAKIGSVGISIKKGISIHGLALNVDLDLTPFSWINPCGLKNQKMTSIKRELEKSRQATPFEKAPESQVKPTGSSCIPLCLDTRETKPILSGLMYKVCDCFIRYFSSQFNFTVFQG